MTAASPSRWLLYGPLAAGAVLLGVYGVFWTRAAAEMRRSIDAFAEAQRAHGRAVAYDGVKTKGFPFLLRGAVANVSIASGDDWGWRAPALYVDALPLAPDRLIFSTLESQRLDLGDFGVWRLETDGRASIGEDGEHGWLVDLQSGPAHLVREDAGARVIDADRALATIAPNTEDRGRIEASLVANNLRTGGATRPVAASIIEAAFAVSETVALAGGDAADAWREAGGALIIHRIAVEADGGVMYLAGALTLDASGYPQGTLNAEFANPGVFALALGELGLVRQSDAQAAAGALTLAALAGGGKLSAPMVFEDGYVAIAGVRLARLPQIR